MQAFYIHFSWLNSGVPISQTAFTLIGLGANLPKFHASSKKYRRKHSYITSEKLCRTGQIFFSNARCRKFL
jgi:hypothetical protein